MWSLSHRICDFPLLTEKTLLEWNQILWEQVVGRELIILVNYPNTWREFPCPGLVNPEVNCGSSSELLYSQGHLLATFFFAASDSDSEKKVRIGHGGICILTSWLLNERVIVNADFAKATLWSQRPHLLVSVAISFWETMAWTSSAPPQGAESWKLMDLSRLWQELTRLTRPPRTHPQPSDRPLPLFSALSHAVPQRGFSSAAKTSTLSINSIYNIFT